ncbi:Hsp33 family molecular chaperone HslO [Paenibacillus aurantius]|uniref:Hsp33 family molecular chaperone HslO n=1 Tax=Paenibacillus aurantius TaxID=2918900 RepID=A0AA96LF65_9BACL|nr:Hsp33 family molecular chaperone HslO [Paenibacillus aurantius]WNQ12083.1 Hsp33 family molecular chaperone HslO [Paenibacillus aurantius]
MEALLIKTLVGDKQARVLYMDGTRLLQALGRLQPAERLLRSAAAEAASLAGLLTGTLKEGQRVTMKIRMSDSRRRIQADADAEGTVRCFLSGEWAQTGPKDTPSTMKEMIGPRGRIQVIRDLGLSSVCTGITDMPHGHLADDLAHYFRQSEQIPTWFMVHTLFGEDNDIRCGFAVMAQLLPGAPDGLLSEIAGRITGYQDAWKGPMTVDALAGLPRLLFPDTVPLGRQSVRLFCGCSKEALFPMLYSLDKKEVVAACAANQAMEAVCHRCGARYCYEPDELARLR